MIYSLLCCTPWHFAVKTVPFIAQTACFSQWFTLLCFFLWYLCLIRWTFFLPLLANKSISEAWFSLALEIFVGICRASLFPHTNFVCCLLMSCRMWSLTNFWLGYSNTYDLAILQAYRKIGMQFHRASGNFPLKQPIMYGSKNSLNF